MLRRLEEGVVVITNLLSACAAAQMASLIATLAEASFCVRCLLAMSPLIMHNLSPCAVCIL